MTVISISEGHEWDVFWYSWNFLNPKETFLFFRDVLFSSVLIRGCVETPGWYLRIFSSNTFLLCWMVLRKLPTYSHLLATRQIQAKFFDAMNLLVRMVSVCSQHYLLPERCLWVCNHQPGWLSPISSSSWQVVPRFLNVLKWSSTKQVEASQCPKYKP